MTASSKTSRSIPGLEPSSTRDGNLQDIAQAGSLHEFLLDLHKTFGPIASFWWGKLYVVSIASVELFDESSHMFDRPLQLFEIFLPLLGQKSIQCTNKDECRLRRSHYGRAFAEDELNKLIPKIQELAEEVSEKWSALLDVPRIPLTQYTCTLSLKTVMLALFGKHMKDEEEFIDFKRSYDAVWSELELRLKQLPSDERENCLQTNKNHIEDVFHNILVDRKANPPLQGEWLLLDYIMSYSDDEELQLADALSFTTTGFLLTWAVYFIARRPDIDMKIQEEIKNVLGNDQVNGSNINKLCYLRQVLQETLRSSVIAPWTARYQSTDLTLGGYLITKNTPVIHALGVVSKDEKVWTDPENFDPERFSKENVQHRYHLCFTPFGFAGKRECPAQKYSYFEATVALVTLLKKFKIHLADGCQVITPVYGLVTRPKDEIWISLSKR